MFWIFDMVRKSILDHWVNAGLHSEEKSIFYDHETILWCEVANLAFTHIRTTSEILHPLKTTDRLERFLYCLFYLSVRAGELKYINLTSELVAMCTEEAATSLPQPRSSMRNRIKVNLLCSASQRKRHIMELHDVRLLLKRKVSPSVCLPPHGGAVHKHTLRRACLESVFDTAWRTQKQKNAIKMAVNINLKPRGHKRHTYTTHIHTVVLWNQTFALGSQTTTSVA